MSNRVYWTDEEEALVFKQIPDVVVGKWPDMWKRVMQVLPVERRKSLASSSNTTNLKHRYEAWLKEHPEFRPSPVQLHNGPLMNQNPHSKESFNRLAAASQETTEPDIIVVEKVVKEEPDYGVIPTSTLARILLERLALMDQFDARFREMEAMIRAKNLAEKNHDVRLGPLPPPPAENKERRIRIAVVGPLDSQAREIEARTASTPKPIELKFYDKDQQTVRPVGIVDYAIVTRHCNHAWWDKMKAVLPADRVFFVDSGIQSVVQRVFDITSRHRE